MARSVFFNVSVRYALLLALLVPCAVCIGVFAYAVPAHADVPLAARLLSIPYNDTSEGGLQVTVNNLSGLRGISNDGTTVYLLDGNGNIVTAPMSAITGSPGGTVTINGTVHTVGWGENGAPSFGDADGRSLAYSHGCLFINNDTSGNTPNPISLYCIDITDWSVTQITVPSDEPLPGGHDWGRGTMIDFADGRIGKVSAYAATSTPSSGYSSYIRMYTVTGTGKSATITWSHDYYVFDSEDWNTDDHGIATDGTYLYRIEFSGSNLPDGDFKSWPLQEDGAPSQEYVGEYTTPFSNMTFLSHDHTGDRYMMGNYAGNQFYITSASDPGPGPGNPLTPAFAAPAYGSHGFTVQVTNYDDSFTWSATTTAGTVSIDGSGLITVAGLLGQGSSATVTASTTKSGVPDGSAQITGTIPDITPPVLSAITASSTVSTATAITWTTDKAATTKLVYSVDNSYASSTAETDNSGVTSHSVSLTGLVACTLYNFEAVSANLNAYYATSTGANFTTPGCAGGATPSAATSTAITVATAGNSTLSAGNDTLAVSTPANFTATSSTITIQIKGLQSSTVLDSIGIPDGLSSAAGTAFDVTALIDNTTVLDSFDSAVTISYTYSAADVAGLNQNSLVMYHYHDGEWLKLDGCSVNTGTKTITCTTPSFSTFAIFGTLQPATHSTSGELTASAGSIRYGCTDPNAPNYAPGTRSDPSMCQYAIVPSSPPVAVCPSYPFTRDLRFGDTGADVKALQTFLNCDGYSLAASGPGSPGNETMYFSTRTRAAVIKFQAAYSVAPDLGYFGPITRARTAALLVK